MVLLYWTAIGFGLGLLAYLLLRARGEQGYNIIGEMLIGSLGSLSVAMLAGVIMGWGQMFRGEIKMDEVIASGVTAAIGALVTLGVMVYLTLRASPVRPQSNSSLR
jgi:hypothetical protein